MSDLQSKLGHIFADSGKMTQALTHHSLGANNNERLEYLGDALLNFVAAEYLFERNPRLDEGGLSRVRAKLICQATLVKVAQRLELADFLQYGHAGKGAINRLLADAVEALFAAVYLDAGIDVAKQVIIRQLDEMFSSGDVDFKKDAKTALQECLQARRLALPTYAVHAVRQSVYTIACTVPTLALESFGDGTTRKAAEQEAAKKMLRLLPQ